MTRALSPSHHTSPSLAVNHPRHLLRSTSLVFGVCVVLSVGCGKGDTAAQPAQAAPAVARVKVESAPVQVARVPQKLRLTGNLRGAQQTDLAANVAGKVLKTNVERGQTVAKGELLAQVDVSSAALALAEARVMVETSQTQESINVTDCQRYEQLKARGVVTDQEYDQVTAKCKTAPLNLKAAQARQSIAAKNVGDGAIRSPFAGVVTERYVEVGEYVQASSRVVSLAQVTELKLEFSLPEQNYPDVKKDALITFRVAAYGEEVFTAQVTRLAGAVRETRDVLVEARVANPDGKLLPGMFADLEVVTGEEELPSVPAAAVFRSNEKPSVYVVKDGVLEQRILQVVATVGDRVAARHGIQPGEQVVIGDLSALENGQRVN